jgi:quercetin dioxygenase-like cupin family protein
MTEPGELDVDRLLRQAKSGFGGRIVELDPNRVLLYDAASWHDALVFVTDGEIEVVCAGGERERFSRGAILCLAPLSVRWLRNTGRAPARIVAIWRDTAHDR